MAPYSTMEVAAGSHRGPRPGDLEHTGQIVPASPDAAQGAFVPTQDDIRLCYRVAKRSAIFNLGYYLRAAGVPSRDAQDDEDDFLYLEATDTSGQDGCISQGNAEQQSLLRAGDVPHQTSSYWAMKSAADNLVRDYTTMLFWIREMEKTTPRPDWKPNAAAGVAGVFGSACAPFLPSYINAILSPVSWAVAGGVVYSVGRAGTKKAVLARCSEKLRKGLAAASNMALDREHEEDIAGFWFVLLDYYL